MILILMMRGIGICCVRVLHNRKSRNRRVYMRVQIKGVGSGFVEQETGRECDEPLYIHITGPEESQVARPKFLTEVLLLVVRAEHAKMAAVGSTDGASSGSTTIPDYAAWWNSWGVWCVYAPPPPGDAPPPPPPPGGAPPDSSGANSQEQYASYWLVPLSPALLAFQRIIMTIMCFVLLRAAYGYDVNSAEFKTWAAEQAEQAEQYYAQQQTQGQLLDQQQQGQQGQQVGSGGTWL
ncbi:hypothetical protein F5050DRAFT_1178125 [Lentinula boryana]|uniref:KHDC4/BBP-like KH-domain type I domain-containing protein n=1 Tax=Lentinula boryana TaxID=40481 RepID=A0ABQ8PYW8_9AGAR|nr:hypothetical protein F5050DRAFT_1178125 [Lentinula boryana]